MIHIIFAVDEKNGYAKNNQIPWNNKEDLKHFKEKTENNIVIMGHYTFESLNTIPLPNRINIIISTQYNSTKEYFVFPYLKDAIQFALTFKKFIYIIGGKNIILETLLNFNNVTFYLTKIEGDYKCDKCLNLDWNRFHYIDETSITNGKIIELKSSFYNGNDIEYLKLAKKVLHLGINKKERTGTGVLSIFGEHMKFNLKEQIPILTTKFIPWKSCIKELLWFIKGQTNSNILSEDGVNIWNKNSSREFLNQNKLEHLMTGDIGAGYGFQWRHFGAKYINCNTIYENQGIDQLENIIQLLKEDPNSRRIYMTAWNPCDLKNMALPPCHVACQFYVKNNKFLSCHLYQRSMDLFLGAPWNILSYSILTYLLAKLCNYEADELIISIGDCHIYNDHISLIQRQFEKLPYKNAELIIKDSVKHKKLNEITIDDFEIKNYNHNEKIVGEMSV